VVVESPWAADDERTAARNEEYARACLADCLRRGEAPFASHLLYTQPGVLNDRDPAQRRQGVAAGFAWRPMAAATVVYVDYGVTDGMQDGIADARRLWQQLEERRLFWPATT
jgi:hypothetical protein